MRGRRNMRDYRHLEWEEWYALARAYYEENGDLIVPRDCMTADGYRLGRWIERQRAIYNQASSSVGYLSKTQIALLEKIGMVWKLEDRFPWKDWIAEVRRYRDTYGDILIPGNYRHGRYHLGNWIRAQRMKYAEGRLSGERVRDLDALGMAWSQGRRRGWMEWYEDAKAYYAAHGDLLVKLNHVTKDGHKLGVWIFTQRDLLRRKRNRPPLTAEQIALLDGIRMVWDLSDVRQEAWERMYAWVSDYLRKNGRLPTQARDAVAPDGRKMSAWISTQRMDLSAGRTPPERKRRLAGLGIREPVKRKGAAAAGRPEEESA